MTARQLVRRQQLLTRELVEQDQQQQANNNSNSSNKSFKLEDFDMIKTIGTGREEQRTLTRKRSIIINNAIFCFIIVKMLTIGLIIVLSKVLIVA